MGVWVAPAAIDDQQVGEFARFDRSERLVPSKDLSAIARGHGDQFEVAKDRLRLGGPLASHPGYFEFAELVFAAAGRPIRANTHEDAAGFGSLDVGGVD